MKVSVMGAGAIGSLFGGLIQRHAPHWQVALVVRGAHGQALRDRGTIGLEGPWGFDEVPIQASDDVAQIAGSDVVLVTVKSQDLQPALSAAAPYLEGATVVSIQNGINDQQLEREVDAERLVMGMTAINVSIIEPGHVSLQLDGATVVGPRRDRRNEAAVRRALEVLRKTQLPVSEHANILGVRYNKLAMNALGYASCISNSNLITEAVCHARWREAVGRPIVDECIEVFRRAEIHLAKIPGRPDIRSVRRFLNLLDKPVLGPAVAAGARRIYNRKPIVFSLSQDLQRGKATEVDYINGHVVRLAEQCGGTAPCNALVVQCVHELETRGASAFLPRAEVIRRFQQLASGSKLAAAGA